MKKSISILTVCCFLFFSCTNEQTTEEKPKTDTTAAYSPAVKDTTVKVPDGPYEERHPNGLIKIKGEYMGGVRHGTWLSFYPDGKIWSEGVYKNGLRNGPATTYFENGNKRYEGFYTDNKESGKWKYWTEDGKLDKEVDHDKK